MIRCIDGRTYRPDLLLQRDKDLVICEYKAGYMPDKQSKELHEQINRMGQVNEIIIEGKKLHVRNPNYHKLLIIEDDDITRLRNETSNYTSISDCGVWSAVSKSMNTSGVGLRLRREDTNHIDLYGIKSGSKLLGAVFDDDVKIKIDDIEHYGIDYLTTNDGLSPVHRIEYVYEMYKIVYAQTSNGEVQENSEIQQDKLLSCIELMSSIEEEQRQLRKSIKFAADNDFISVSASNVKWNYRPVYENRKNIGKFAADILSKKSVARKFSRQVVSNQEQNKQMDLFA